MTSAGDTLEERQQVVLIVVATLPYFSQILLGVTLCQMCKHIATDVLVPGGTRIPNLVTNLYQGIKSLPLVTVTYSTPPGATQRAISCKTPCQSMNSSITARQVTKSKELSGNGNCMPSAWAKRTLCTCSRTCTYKSRRRSQP